MHLAMGMVAQWSGGRIAIGSEPLARLLVHIGVWALARAVIGQGAGLLDATPVAVPVAATLASALVIVWLRRGGDLRISRHRRSPPGPSGQQ